MVEPRNNFYQIFPQCQFNPFAILSFHRRTSNALSGLNVIFSAGDGEQLVSKIDSFVISTGIDVPQAN